MEIKPTIRISVELVFDASQLTELEIRRALWETLEGFTGQNIEFVSLTNPNTGDVYGARLVGFQIGE